TDEDILEKIALAAAAKQRSLEAADAQDALGKLIADLPEFADKSRAVVNIHGWHGFSPHTAAAHMTEIARERGDPSAALTWLRKVCAATEATGGVTRALY